MNEIVESNPVFFLDIKCCVVVVRVWENSDKVFSRGFLRLLFFCLKKSSKWDRY